MILNQDVPKIIKEYILQFHLFEKIYLFGSILNSCDSSNDIDLLIIYKEYSKKLDIDLRLFINKIEEACGIPVDLTALSNEEEKEVRFLEKITPNYLVLK